jgi:hypothetical protein
MSVETARLRTPVIKGETDEDLDPSLSERSWNEALALAEKLGDGDLREAACRLGHTGGHTSSALVAFGQKDPQILSNFNTVRWPRG